MEVGTGELPGISSECSTIIIWGEGRGSYQNVIYLSHRTLGHKMHDVNRLEPLGWPKYSALPERDRRV